MELHTSETISDTSNTSTNNELSLSFEIDNGGTETSYVEDKLLTNYEVAKARAESIFLDEGHINKRISFSTYHIDNLNIGDIFKVDGLLYKTISINEKIQGARVSMDIIGERFVPPLTCSYDGILVIKYNSPEAAIHDMVEFSGYIYATTGADGRIYRSELDSDAWSVVYDHPTEGYFYSCCVHAGYIYAGTGNALGQIYRSSNGTDWVLSYDSVSVTLRTLTSHSDGYIYAGGSDGRVYRSLDGVTWAQVWSGAVQDIKNLYSCTDGYVYASTGNLGKVYRSNNGTTWTLVYDFAVAYVQSFIYRDGAYYATTGSDAKIYRSTDLVTWTQVYYNSGDFYIWCIMANIDGYLYAGSGNAGRIYRSLDGITWTVYLDTVESYVYKLFQSSTGRFYAGTSPNGHIYADSLIQSGGE